MNVSRPWVIPVTPLLPLVGLAASCAHAREAGSTPAKAAQAIDLGTPVAETIGSGAAKKKSLSE